jgi:putative ABC transport system permease protein
MSEYWFELRHAARALMRTPWFTLTAVLMLGVGLGLVMYMFGAIQSFILRPLPFAGSDKLIHVEMASPKRKDDSVEVPIHDYLAFRDAQTSVESLAAFYPGTVNLSGDLRPERYDGAFVTADTFEVLGVKPILGRGFQPGDDKPGAAPVVVLSHALWQNRFQGDGGIVGRAVRVNGKDAVVAGVMPEGFRFPVKEQVWLPLDTDVGKVKRGEGSSLEVFGRLKPGATIQQAQAEFDGLVKQQAAAFPETSIGEIAVVKPYRDEFIGKNTRRMLFTMLSAVALVLGIACANVANLMLARAAARSRECAIRSALGASRRRIIAQTLLEAMLVALAGGGIGLWLAYVGGAATMHALASSEDPPPYWFLEYRIDGMSVAFTFGIALLAAAVAGLIPALRASSSNPALTMREGGAGQIGAMGKLARFLVSAEIAACMVLLFTAGLNMRAVMAMSQVDGGFETAGMLTGRIGLFPSAYPAEADVVAFQEKLEQRLAEMPGASNATIASGVPTTFSGADYVRAEGQLVADSGDLPVMSQVSVGTRYFDTIGVRIVEGRGFTTQDRPDSDQVVVVSQAMAAKLWPGQPALGKRVGLGRAGAEPKWRTVVGVASEVAHDPNDAKRGAYYLPFAQSPTRFMSLILRTPGDAASMAASMRATVESVDRDLPIYWLRSMDDWLGIAEFDHRLTATLFGMFGAFAVLLASAGIYAVLAYAVSRRTREIGVMRALGARDSGVLRAVFGQSVRQLAIGLGVGVVLAFGFAQLIARMLEGVSSYDPATFVSVALLLTLVSLAAALVPTRRALRIEPMTALNLE